MSMTYLETLAAVEAAGSAGLAYAKITRAMKVHVRSLVNDGVVGVYTKGTEEGCSLDDPQAVICTTESGSSYVSELVNAGLIAEAALVAKPKTPRTRTTAPSKTEAVVPTALESVVSPVIPDGSSAVRVQGNHLGDQLLVSTPSSEEDRIEALERKLSALMAAVLA